MRLAILTPSNRDPKWGFIKSLEAMEKFAVANSGIISTRIETIQRIPSKQCSLLPQGRQNLLSAALDHPVKFTHALWLDDDMAFPHGLMNLLSRSFDLPPYPKIIAANYVRKDERVEYTAVKDGIAVCSDPPASCLEEVDSCGMGCMMLELDAVRHIEPPHFEILWDNATGDYRSEDRYFCDKMRAAGIKVYIDHGLSRMVNHIGDMAYGYKTRVEMKHEMR